MARKPYIANRNVALWGGLAAVVVGSLMLHDAYENRGRRRPFAAKFLPGP